VDRRKVVRYKVQNTAYHILVCDWHIGSCWCHRCRLLVGEVIPVKHMYVDEDR
jgi:hypothetical protein